MSTLPDSFSPSPAGLASDEDLQLTKLETAFIVGIVGCLLFATWQLGDLLVHEWLAGWVGDSALREDILYYGVAFSAAIAALATTTRSAFYGGRFGRTLSRALLWYGALLLISVSGMGAIEYLPEVASGLVGAALLVGVVYVLQRRYFTSERITLRRLRNDECPECGEPIRTRARFCSHCGGRVGGTCPDCDGYVSRHDDYCASCGRALGTT
ncbi:MAG: zinc ribbon domain-containing protein [Salinibacter sp.]